MNAFSYSKNKWEISVEFNLFFTWTIEMALNPQQAINLVTHPCFMI